MRVDEQYLDVLQNIEFAIVSVFRSHPDLSDFAVMRALDGAIARYNAERRGLEPKPISLPEQESLIYDRVKDMCELRLGRGSASTRTNVPVLDGALKVEEIVTCLRKIRKSVDRWNQRNGRQGYLRFVSEYVK